MLRRVYLSVPLMCIAFWAQSAHVACAKTEDEFGPVVSAKKEIFTAADFADAKPFLDTAMSTPMEVLIKDAAKLKTKPMLSYGFGLEFGRYSATGALTANEKALLARDFADAARDLKVFGIKKMLNENIDAWLEHPEFWEVLAEDLSQRQSVKFQGAPEISSNPTATSSADVPTKVTVRGKRDYDFDHIGESTIWAAKSCAQDARTIQKTTKLAQLDPDQPFKKISREAYLRIRERALMIRREAWISGVMNCGGETYFLKLTEFASQSLGPLEALRDDPNYRPPELAGVSNEIR